MSELISHYERRLFRLFIFIVQPVGNNMLNIGYRTEDIRFNYYIFFFYNYFPSVLRVFLRVSVRTEPVSSEIRLEGVFLSGL